MSASWAEEKRSKNSSDMIHRGRNTATCLNATVSCDSHIVSEQKEKRICEESLPLLNNNRLLILVYRLVAVVILTLLWVFRQQADTYLESGWQVLRASWLFQHESFEASGQHVQIM